MNERIKQLAIQADIKFLEFHGKEYCEAWVEQQEKFAELIVRECAEVCYLYNAAGGADTAFVYGYKDCGDDIKHHFGVKE